MPPTSEQLRALLEAAARACGYLPRFCGSDGVWWCWFPERDMGHFWLPHSDDGDGARMEAACKRNVVWGTDDVSVGRDDEQWSAERYTDHNNDRQAARRWASLRAAAACAPKED